MAGLVISASQLRKLRPREVQGHTRGKGWSRIQTQTSGCPLGAHTALRLLFPTPPPPYLPPTGMWELRLVEHPWLSRLRLQAAGALDQAHPQPAVLPGGDCPTPSPGASPRRKEGAADCQGWEGI